MTHPLHFLDSVSGSPLAGRSALITGGGSGIGAAAAEALLVDGASVTLVGRRSDVLAATAAELALKAPAGAEVRWHAADCSDEAEFDAAVAAASAGQGLDMAVFSAGTGTLGPLVNMDLAEWQRVIETNLTGTFLGVKHCGQAMMDTGRGGTMVAISSVAAARSHRWMGPYCASKAAIDSLVEVAADELGRSGIRVNSVRPGVVQTDLGDHLLNVPGVPEDYLAQMPVSRVGHVGDVAAAVRFLLGPESSWVTGVSLSVDGGMHLRRGPDLDGFARMLFGDSIPPGS